MWYRGTVKCQSTREKRIRRLQMQMALVFSILYYILTVETISVTIYTISQHGLFLLLI